MSQRLLAFSALLATVLCFNAVTGCKKHNDNSGNPSITLSVTISGSAFKPQLNNAAYGTISHSFILGGTTVNNGDTTLISLKLDPPVTLNTDLGASGLAFLEYQAKGQQYLSGTGWGRLSFTVSALDSVKHTIAGSFSGSPWAMNRRDSLPMTNGSFSGTYSVVNNF
jgi:hypothetical protein